MSEYSLLARSLCVRRQNLRLPVRPDAGNSCEVTASPHWRVAQTPRLVSPNIRQSVCSVTSTSERTSSRLFFLVFIVRKREFMYFLTSQRWMTDPSPLRGKMLDVSVSLRPPSIRPWWLSSSCVSWRHPATVVLLIHRERQGGKQFVQVSFCLNKHLKLSSVSHFTSHQGPSSH